MCAMGPSRALQRLVVCSVVQHTWHMGDSVVQGYLGWYQNWLISVCDWSLALLSATVVKATL